MSTITHWFQWLVMIVMGNNELWWVTMSIEMRSDNHDEPARRMVGELCNEAFGNVASIKVTRSPNKGKRLTALWLDCTTYHYMAIVLSILF